jgi:hypothetical protein
MNLGKIVLAAVIPLLLGGCSIYKDVKIVNIGTEFDKSSKGYLNLLRWQEFESALTTYVSVPMQDEYRKKIKETGEARIVDYRVKKKECDPARGDATVIAELDYYRPPSVTVKTVVDTQKWSYEGENDQHSWRLTTLLPDFK